MCMRFGGRRPAQSRHRGVTPPPLAAFVWGRVPLVSRAGNLRCRGQRFCKFGAARQCILRRGRRLGCARAAWTRAWTRALTARLCAAAGHAVVHSLWSELPRVSQTGASGMCQTAHTQATAAPRPLWRGRCGPSCRLLPQFEARHQCSQPFSPCVGVLKTARRGTRHIEHAPRLLAAAQGRRGSSAQPLTTQEAVASETLAPRRGSASLVVPPSGGRPSSGRRQRRQQQPACADQPWRGSTAHSAQLRCASCPC